MNNIRISLIVTFIFIRILNIDAQELQMSMHFTGSFDELVSYIEKEVSIRIYYDYRWTDDIEVSLNTENELVINTLKDVLRGRGLHVEYIEGRGIFILPDQRLKKQLPEKLTESTMRTSGQRSDDYMGVKGDEYLTGTRPEQIMRTITVGSQNQSVERGMARIRGKITDMETGDPIAGATMVIMETGKGAVTDSDGFLLLTLRPGNYTAQFNFIGKEQINCRLEVLSDGRFELEMSSSVIAIDEVQILADQYRDINSTDVGVMRMTMKSLKKVPVFMGENDVIKISKMLPGITSAGEASSGVNVRGGNVDQNVFYINRMPVYNTSHLFGFFSAFNSDIIRDFSIYKGNVPANYGGRLSSVFSILTRQGNNKKFTAHAGISPVSGHLTVEGPVVKEKASFIVSGRSSYSDWILRRMEDPDIRESEASFYDFAGSFNVEVNDNNQLMFFYYQSFDKFNYSTLSDYDYANRGGSITWKHTFSPALTASTTATVSNYSFGHIEKAELSRAYKQRYHLNHNELVSGFTWVPAMGHKVEFGGNLIFYNLDRGTIDPYGPTSIRERSVLGKENGLEGGLFLSDNYSINHWLSVYGGFRYSFFTNLGPQTVRYYEEGYPKSEATVNSTEEFTGLQPIAFYSGPEIRSAINMKADQNTSFKLSFNQMRQYLMMLSNTVTISPTDQWKLSDYHIIPPVSYQYSGGVYHIMPYAGLSASVELYYKHANHIIDYKDGADFVNTRYLETEILQGRQKAYGAEMLLEKNSGRLNGWISYTYSRSIMHVPGNNEFESINNGDPYPSNFDRPNVLNLVANYSINRRFNIGSNVVYMTGRPVTYPSSLYFIGDIVYIDYFSRNKFRVPDYFRIDLSFSIEGNLKSKKLMHSTWNFNVYNLLGRNNPQSLFFEPNKDFIKGYAFSVIGSPVFTLTWNVKLGNYESN